MGQCTSNKAKGGHLNVKKILSHKKPKKMDKHKHHKVPQEDNHKESKNMDSNKKPPQKYTKGVAMSFGFKRRPTPMTTNNSSVAWDCGTTMRSDANGNKDESTNSLARQTPIAKERILHKTSSSQRQAQVSITPKSNRYSFPQNAAEQRTNKVGDIRHSPFPLHFAPHPQATKFASRRMSPNAESEKVPHRTFTRNVTIVTRTEVIEKDEVARDGVDHGSAPTNFQTGKFTLQTTRLPQPEPIRVIETKTAKTIANNNRRSARIWRQYEEASLKVGNDDSGFGSNASGGLGENEPVVACSERKSEDDSLHERLQGRRKFSLMENSDSFSDVCTPPPLPELPPAFNIAKHIDSNKEKAWKTTREEYNPRKSFLKSTTNSSTFLKNKGRHLLDRDSPQSSSDQEWINGGEAMADDVSLTLSPQQHMPHRITEHVPTQKSTGAKSGVIAETVLQTLLKPSVSLEMIDNLKESMNLSLSDEDPNFTAVATNNNTAALLDDEILSPVESLLSSSETEDLVKKKPTHSSSNSKDVNEKLTPSLPGTPSNATYSLSLSDDKEDFLIDDEIADQPELVFGEKGEPPFVKDQKPIDQMRTSYNPDFSPLPLRKRYLHNTSTNQGSFDSLSPCDSIGSEDLMMDYDVSQTNDIDIWDRQSESFTALEGNPKTKFKIDDTNFNSKNFFIKSLTPKHSLTTNRTKNNSPTSLKSRSSRRSSPDCRSPKRNHFNPFGYQSMTYDPASECLTLTRANHSAVQQDIIGIKTMLLTLKRVLNESESHNPMKNCTDEIYEGGQNNGNNNNSEFRLELADLRRQVIFLQGQLEDKEKTVSNLQRQIDNLATQNTQNNLDNAPILTVEIHNRCNAATQTERARPLSTGVFSLTSSPIEDNNPILRLMVK